MLEIDTDNRQLCSKNILGGFLPLSFRRCTLSMGCQSFVDKIYQNEEKIYQMTSK
jgi:hypothetical protein